MPEATAHAVGRERNQRDVVVRIGARNFAAWLVKIDPQSPGEQRAIGTIVETDLVADAPDLAAAAEVPDR